MTTNPSRLMSLKTNELVQNIVNEGQYYPDLANPKWFRNPLVDNSAP